MEKLNRNIFSVIEHWWANWCANSLTINGKPSQCIIRFTPSIWLSGRMAKLPTKPPILSNDTTNDDSVNVNGATGNVLFSVCRSLKLMVAHPVTRPVDRVNRLPNSKDSFDFYFAKHAKMGQFHGLTYNKKSQWIASKLVWIHTFLLSEKFRPLALNAL